jgi:hypothetical protein
MAITDREYIDRDFNDLDFNLLTTLRHRRRPQNATTPKSVVENLELRSIVTLRVTVCQIRQI